MADRILGPQGSKRRRRFLWVPMLVVACTALFSISGAQAVHDLGVFQLDGNALTSQNSTPPASDDWDKVCHQVTVTNDPNPPNAIPDQCTSSSDTTGAVAVAWVAEPNRNSSLFTTGGSKDPNNVSSWAWKDGAGGLPDKDNLEHAFAARYSVPGAGGTTDCPVGTTCDVLYFGSDRFDNSGDAQQGFWFLQNACKLGSPANGGGGFLCEDPTPGTDPSDDFHRIGDLLVLSDFSNGGSNSTINIYRWNPACTKTGQVLGNGNTCGDANLEFLKGSAAANCGTPNFVGDDFCGLVNGSTTNLPWSFTDKSSTPNNGALNGEFFEAGVNLTPLGLGGECFATLESETRSSTSTTATLKDFVISSFAPCRASISTTPSQTAVNPGVAVHDTATIVGNQPGKYPGVSDGAAHSVNFYLCSFPVGDTTDGCSSTSNSIGSGTLAADNATTATSTAQSPDVNTSGSPLSPGHYCFLATWAGDSNYTDALPRPGETETGECFDVSVIDTAISTSQPAFYPNDSATISTADGSNLPAGGSLVFTLYDTAANCTAGGTTGQLMTPQSFTVTGGNPTETHSTTNSTFALNSSATAYWRVVYTTNSAAYTNRESKCVESVTHNTTDDPGPGTKP